MSIPHLLRCPISLDLFTDPVTLSTGQTYDRPNIEKWLADGNLTCPVTMQRLRDTSVVPNHTLRHLIDRWLLAVPDHECVVPSDNNRFPLATLKHNLQSPDATVATRRETLYKVRILATESDTGQACLVQLGFFPVLLQLLFQNPQLDSPELTEVALDCILGLSPSGRQLGSLNMLKKDSNLASLLLLLEQGTAKTKTSLCYLLEAIATSTETQELCLILGQEQRVLQELVSLLQIKSQAQASEAAVRAVSGVCSIEANRSNAIREGAVDGLISYLSDSTYRNASRALATLEMLAGVETGRRALVKNPNAVGVLVKMVFRVSSDHKGSEHAVGSLMAACHESARLRVEAVNAGVLTQLLLLLQSQCSTKAKSKARSLLKLLRSMWDDDPVPVVSIL